MSDYKYIKFTGLTAINGQTERIFPLFGLKRVLYNNSTPYTNLKIELLLANPTTEDTVQIEVVGADGNQFTDAGTAGTNDEAAYIAFCNEILDFYFGLTSTSKTLTTVKAGENGDIAPTLGRITQVAIA
jgi:hypothetical protein